MTSTSATAITVANTINALEEVTNDEKQFLKRISTLPSLANRFPILSAAYAGKTLSFEILAESYWILE